MEASPTSSLCLRGTCEGTQRGNLAAAQSERSQHSYSCRNCLARSCELYSSNSQSWALSLQQVKLRHKTEGRETAIARSACSSITGGKERLKASYGIPQKKTAELVNPRALHQLLRAPHSTSRLQLGLSGADNYCLDMAQEKENNRIRGGCRKLTLQIRLPGGPWQSWCLRPPGKHPACSSQRRVWLAWVRGRPAPSLLCVSGREMSYFLFWPVSHFSNAETISFGKKTANWETLEPAERCSFSLPTFSCRERQCCEVPVVPGLGRDRPHQRL